jgi:anthranilate phosphoribosyltransferase
MRHAIGPRKEIGIRTFFNLLGPLTNPAGAKVQLLGVYKKELTGILAEVLGKLGTKRAMVVHGADGLDEITISGPTYISEWNRGKVLDYKIHPEVFGIARTGLEDLKGGTANENAKIILDIFKGRKGPARDVVILNTAAALYIAELAQTLAEGITIAGATIDQGKALEKLETLVQWTNASA